MLETLNLLLMVAAIVFVVVLIIGIVAVGVSVIRSLINGLM